MTGPSRLSVVVFSGDYDRVHYALAVASAAAATGRPATLFFTMGALAALLGAGADGAPGWTRLGDGGGLPAAERDAAYAEAGIATFEELLAACVELGVDFMVCEMGLRAEGLAAAALRADVPVREGGLVTFLGQAEGGAGMLFV